VDTVRDPERVAAVRATQLLDTAPEEPFDGLAAHAAALLDAPLAFVSLVDDRRIFWKSAIGLDPSWQGGRGMPVDESFCRLVVAAGEPVLVTDAHRDARARGTGAIETLGIVAWAGHPIRSAEGHVLGILCVGDRRPREWTAQHAAVLAALAGAASSEVGLRSALTAGEAGALRVATLARVTAELSEALTPDEVVGIALRESASVLDGDAAALCLLAEDELVLAAAQGIEPRILESFRRVPVDAPLSLTRCLDAGEAIWLPDHEAWRRACPTGAGLFAGSASAAGILPLAGHRDTLGVVMVIFEGERDVEPAERELAETLVHQCAQALERARLYAAEASARSRTERLQRLTAALASTLDEEDVARLIVSEGMAALGAIAGVLMLREHDGVRVLAAAGYPPDVLVPGEVMPLDAPLPLVDVLRTGEPFWFESVGDWPESYPARSVGLGMSSVAVGLPLSAHGTLIGAVAFRFSEDEQRFSAEERGHALALAAQCSSALERARLHHAEQRAREAAERAEDRARLLADVSLALDAPVGLVQRFDALVRAVVPRLADFCTVRVIDENGHAPLVAYRHADPAKHELVRAAYGGDESLALRGGPADVIRSGEAVLLPELDEDRWAGLPHDEAFLARLRELAPVSYVGVPITARGRAIGALALLSGESGRRFTEDDRDLAVEIGRRAGLALDNAILYEGQRQVAETLQEALLPLELPAMEGGALARRYVASSEPGRVGGDWYDAIPLPEGRVLLCVGDVVGRGPQAAAVMGQLRGALGIFAGEDPEPGPLLDRLAGFAVGVPDTMGTTTAICLVDLASREVRYVCAGHPPPLVVPEDRLAPAWFLWEGRSPPLGLSSDGPRPQAARRLAPGDILLLYTDGLIERARESIDESLERLRDAASGTGAPSADALCDALLGMMAAGRSGEDDTALLALRLDPATPEPLEVSVPAEAAELATLRRSLSGWLHEAGAGAAGDDVVLAGSEAAANCVEHAYHRRAAGTIRMRARVAGGTVELEVADTGRWRASPAPGDRGRGLGMMRALMDDVAVRTDAGGTVVRMSRRLGRGSRHLEPAPAPLGPSGARVALTRHRDDAGGVVVVAELSGDVDHAAAPGLLARLRREVAAGDELTADLQEVAFIDSAGIRLVADLIERSGARRVRLVVRRDSTAHRAVDLVGLAAAPRVELEARG
jgi:anti-anti-sigma factor